MVWHPEAWRGVEAKAGERGTREADLMEGLGGAGVEDGVEIGFGDFGGRAFEMVGLARTLGDLGILGAKDRDGKAGERVTIALPGDLAVIFADFGLALRRAGELTKLGESALRREARRVPVVSRLAKCSPRIDGEADDVEEVKFAEGGENWDV
jgi:hypothetical protein